MKRRVLLSMLLGAGAVMPALGAAPLPEIEVFKSRYCGCCGQWAQHMKSAGFSVKETLVDDTTAARKRLGLPDRFGSCHTATAERYVLEGHVPAAEVKRLLADKRDVLGLAVPSMPPSSPGMDPTRRDPYDVLLIDRKGRESVYARYPK